jgi:hypothetical protein
MSLVSYIDDLARLATKGGRVEDAIRTLAMRAKNIDPSDWQMSHQPPLDLESGAPLSRLYQMYPEDVYTRPRIYASTPEELSVASILNRVRDKDTELVDIYRAVPRWVSDIEPGQWVTPSLGYARRHADIIRRPDNPTVILAGKAPAGNLLSEGNSLAEFGLVGDAIRPARRLDAPAIADDLLRMAQTGDRGALEMLVRLYGLDAIAAGLA